MFNKLLHNALVKKKKKKYLTYHVCVLPYLKTYSFLILFAQKKETHC